MPGCPAIIAQLLMPLMILPPVTVVVVRMTMLALMSLAVLACIAGAFANVRFHPAADVGDLDALDALRSRGEPVLDGHAAVEPRVEHQVAVVPPGCHHLLRDALAEAQHVLHAT